MIFAKSIFCRIIIRKGRTLACKKNDAVYDEDALSKSITRKQLVNFAFDNFDVGDIPRSARIMIEKVFVIFEKVQQGKYISIVDIGMELGY